MGYISSAQPSQKTADKCASCKRNIEKGKTAYIADCCGATYHHGCAHDQITTWGPPQCLCGKRIKRVTFDNGKLYDYTAKKILPVLLKFAAILTPLLWYNPYFYKDVNQIHYKGVFLSFAASAAGWYIPTPTAPLNLGLGKFGNFTMNTLCVMLAALTPFFYLQLFFQHPCLVFHNVYNFAAKKLFFFV